MAYSIPQILLYLVLGVGPSLIWLLFFLREDAHPEPNWMIVKIFLYGVLLAAPIFLLEVGFGRIINFFQLPIILLTLLGAPLIEEGTKLILVKRTVVWSPALDEPVDVMLYLIIAALGFAALENSVYIFASPAFKHFGNVFLLSGMRLVGAVFLHALAAGLMGYFLALSFNRSYWIWVGLIAAVSLHSAFNYFTMEAMQTNNLLAPLILLVAGILVLLAFRELRSMESICKI